MASRIPVERLRTGMTVLEKHGKIVLKEYFITSHRFPSISFVTAAGAIVIWHRCGYVWVE
jgi:hypothetical protein